MREDEARAIIETTGWLSGETKAIRDAVIANSRLRTFNPGEAVFHIEDEQGGIFGIVDGGFGVYVPSTSSRVLLSEVLRQGIWFGTGPVLSNRSRALSFRAVEASDAFHLSLRAMQLIQIEIPEFKGRLGALSDQNYASPIRIIGDLLIPSIEHRVAATLLRISRSHYDPPGHHQWIIRLSQSDIAEMSNASRDRVNRALTKFEEMNWIKVDYKAIQILNPSALHDFAGSWGAER